jgi:bifunctional aspartokinase / homoserine dehydrogenase 1
MDSTLMNQEMNLSHLAGDILVMKFGGTSVGTPAAMYQSAQIVRQSLQEWPRLVVVVSALSTVTNLLLEGALQAAEGNLQTYGRNTGRLLQLHHAITRELLQNEVRRKRVEGEVERLIGEFSNLCQAIAILGEATPRALDTVAALGERLSARLMAAVLEENGVASQAIEATRLIQTDDRFQNAHPDFIATTRMSHETLEPILAQGNVAVVTGFIAATSNGITTTLGRGGSDYTAGILGAVLPATDVWIWTDVDGVMSTDPRIVPEARTIPEITYREIAELAYYGAKVLHPKTIRPLVDAGIGLRICNTFNPTHPGTRLIRDRNGMDTRRHQNATSAKDLIKAVTAISSQCMLTVEGRGMLGVPGVAARTFAAVASTGTSVPLITQASSEQSICFAVPAEASERVLSALQKAFSVELANQDIDRIWSTGETAIITVVGAGMIHTPGVAGRVFSALGENGVNVIAIAQGSSEVSISLVVDSRDTETAVKVLHALIVAGDH